MDPITEPIPNEQNDNEEEQIEQLPKKKELSQKQIDHLNNIRVKALERKREIKLQKHEEYKKQAMEKKIQQIELNTPCAAVTPSRQEPIKQEPKQDTRCAAVVSPRPIKQEPIKQEPIKQEPIKQEPIKQEPIKQEEAKPKKKVLKKVIRYVQADEDDDDDNVEVIIKNLKRKKNKLNSKILNHHLNYDIVIYYIRLHWKDSRLKCYQKGQKA